MTRTVLLTLAITALAGCYNADFDIDADGVFRCDADSDCPSTHACVLAVCRADAGPQLSIEGPEEGSTFQAGTAVVFPLSLSGSDLTLDSPGATDINGSGFLRIEVDGAVFGDPVVSGNVSQTQTIDLGMLEGGLHRIRVRAFRLDGTVYDNPSATADVAFWVDDGAPHIGIRSPWPGDPHPVGVVLPVEIRCLNCAFIEPDQASGTRIDDPVPEGHTHVYYDRREGIEGTLDYPACLPDCNFEYAQDGSIKPTGSGTTNRVTGSTGEVPTKPGSLTITASLNYTGHFPYPSDNLDPTMWAASPELVGQLVHDSIKIELVQ